MSPNVPFRIRPRNHLIERFGDRVHWAMQNLEPRPKRNAKIHSLKELWSVLTDLGDLGLTEKTWKRSLTQKNQKPVPDAIVQALVQTFPDLPEDVLLSPRFSDFQIHALPITAARKRWQDAVYFLAKHRDLLASVGKCYHARVDADPNFPVITKPGWILRTPVELTEHSEMPEYDPFVSEPPACRLENLNVDFIQLRIAMMKRGRNLFNGDSYRTLDIKPKAGKLDLTFGPTKYFQIVNTCEAIAAELSDFVSNNPNRIPSHLELRGPPEAIFDFKNRSTYAVIACLLFIKNYSVNIYSKSRYRDQFVLHERGDDTVESQNTIAVVPAGGHQPIAVNFGDRREVALWRSAVREFCEELFNKEEAAILRRHGESFLDLPEVKPYVDALFRSGAARVFLMGVGLDPVTTKCEFMMAIVVDWKKASRSLELKIEENYEGTVSFHDLTKRHLFEEATKPRKGKPLYPSSKACLLLGHRHFDFLMK
jgi:hypothetical protein